MVEICVRKVKSTQSSSKGPRELPVETSKEDKPSQEPISTANRIIEVNGYNLTIEDLMVLGKH